MLVYHLQPLRMELKLSHKSAHQRILQLRQLLPQPLQLQLKLKLLLILVLSIRLQLEHKLTTVITHPIFLISRRLPIRKFM